MSLSLTNIQQTMFDAEVKAAYQSVGNKLRPTVYTKTNIAAEFIQFRKVGEMTAELVTYQDNVNYQDPGYDKVVATMNPYAAAGLTATLQELTTNVDDRRELAMLSAYAMGRRIDQNIIDVMANATLPTGNVIPADFQATGGNTNFTFAKIKEIVRIWDDTAVDPQNRFLAISARQQSDLFSMKEFTDSRFTARGPNAITTGSLDGSDNMSFNLIVIPTMLEGGLPKDDNNIRSCFAWHRRSVGLGFASDIETNMQPKLELISYLVVTHMLMGAQVIDPRGVIEILCDETPS